MIGCVRATEARHCQPCIHKRYWRIDEGSHGIRRRECGQCLVPERERIPQVFQDLLFGPNIIRPACRPGESRAGWRSLPEHRAIKHEIRCRHVLHLLRERPHLLVLGAYQPIR